MPNYVAIHRLCGLTAFTLVFYRLRHNSSSAQSSGKVHFALDLTPRSRPARLATGRSDRRTRRAATASSAWGNTPRPLQRLVGPCRTQTKALCRMLNDDFTHPRIALVALATGRNTSLIFQTSDTDAGQPIGTLRRGSAVVSIDLRKRSAMDLIRNGQFARPRRSRCTTDLAQ